MLSILKMKFIRKYNVCNSYVLFRLWGSLESLTGCFWLFGGDFEDFYKVGFVFIDF